MVLLILFALLPAMATERPPIVGIANFVVKTDNLEEIRKFYTGVLGYEEVFKHKRTGSTEEFVVFKVNDHQYIEVSQTLANEADDKLIQIGFETKDARKLRDYLFEKGLTVPAKLGKDPDGNYSFVVKDPEGHNVEFVEYRERLTSQQKLRQVCFVEAYLRSHASRWCACKGRGRAGQVL